MDDSTASSVASDENRQKWIDIQRHTFSNWINEQLQSTAIRDLTNDLSDGVTLIRLVETLQGRRYYGKVYDQNPTEIQKLMNVQMALDALREDGVKTVNIGTHDIVEGNTKLILGLIWCLVQRYQIASKTKIPPKKLMMAWMQSVLPELKLTNFRTNWNDGRALSALLEYCQPGLCQEWRGLDPTRGLENCERALLLAERYLGVPRIISAQHLASPHLDELSCITYLSYFITKGAPGYRATLQRVQMLLPDTTVSDFETSWSDGYVLSLLVEAVGGQVPGMDEMRFDMYKECVKNISVALEAAADIRIGSLIGPDDIADPQGEHLGTMALAAALCSVGPEPQFSTTQCFTQQQVNLDLAFSDGSEVRVDDLDVKVLGPLGHVLSHETLKMRKSRTAKGAVLSLIPYEPGYHQVRIYCLGAELPSSPISLHVLSPEESRAASRLSAGRLGGAASPTSATRPPAFSPTPNSGKTIGEILRQREHQGYLEQPRKHQHFTSSPTGSTDLLQQNSARNNTVTAVQSVERGTANAVNPASVARADSSASEIDISHKPFAQRRQQIIQQLEAQNTAHIKRASEQQKKEGNGPTAIPTHNHNGWQQYSQRGYDQNIPPPPPFPPASNHTQNHSHQLPASLVEANAHKEMPLAKQTDVSLVSFSGLTEPCCVGSIVEVVINAHGDVPSGSVYVEAVSPSGRSHPCNVQMKGPSYMATFVPTEVGAWRIGILYEGDHIRGSPFTCEVFDPSLVNVYGLDVGLVGQELRFTVNASHAGHGIVKVTVLRHGREIPCSIEEIDNNSRVYRVTFMPDGAGQYRIHVLYNRMEIKGSPFILDIADASSVSVYGENLKMASVGRLATFMVHAVGADTRDLSVHVTGPSKRPVPATVSAVDSTTFRADWTPQEAGEHALDVRLAGQPVAESPFLCNVGAPESVHVRNMPRRIGTNRINEEVTFEIDASAAGSGNLEIMINGGRVPCRVKEIGSRQYLAIFTPTQSVSHTIEMRFNGEPINGSPWKLPVEDREDRRNNDRTMSYYSELSGPGLVRAPINRTAAFEITGEGLELSDIQAKIYGPDGREFPIRIVPRGAGKYTAEYRIEQVGEHLLTVWIAGRKVDGSPLSVAGYATERVRIEPLGGGTPGQPVQFVVDAVDAGKGQLEISVNQGRVPNNVQMQGAGRCLVTFIPQHAGTYVIDVTFNGEQVHGCPIKVEILPKQVGSTIQANLTPTAVSTAISAGSGVNIAGAFRSGGHSSRSPASPTSPTLLRDTHTHTRQRSEESTLRSPTLLRDSRTTTQKPWQTSYAPTSSRLSSSLSPSRNWNATSTYSDTYRSGGYDDIQRTISPTDPSRQNIRESTTIIRRTPSPTGITSRQITTETIIRHSPTPPYSSGGVRTREFADRIARSPSPVHYTSTYTTREERTYRSPSPKHYEEVRTTSPRHYEEVRERTISPHYRRTPSPVSGERVKRIERIDPIAEEAERERRRLAEEQHERDRQRVGYTVAQYGEPGEKRYFGDTLERTGRSYAEEPARPASPEYSAVYERYERKPHETEGYTSPTHHIEQPAKSPTPPPDYDTRPEGGNYVTSYLKYSGPRLVQESDTKTTTYSTPYRPQQVSPPPQPHFDSVDRSIEREIRPRTPEGRTERTDEPSEMRMNQSSKDFGHIRSQPEPSFLRTQSEKIHDDVTERTHLHRTEEKESVYDMPPEFEPLHRTSEIQKTPLSEAEKRTAEILRVKEEDDKILSKHGFFRSKHKDEHEKHKGGHEKYEKHERVPTPPPIIEERAVETRETREAVDLAEAPIQTLQRAGELPHSPAPSVPTTPSATPKAQTKFKKEEGKIVGAATAAAGGVVGKTFDFGKSKFTAKHEVIKRGKEVDVRLESLKLGKEDVLRIVVQPPLKGQHAMMAQNGQSHPPELEHKVKKSGSKYEITFKPTEVGTHKIFAYVNEIQHPQSPFNIRIYDASEMIVGEIPKQSSLNDTVEFTVDAGRAGFGNLEMAIKDADGVIIPSHVAQLETGTAKFLVTFTPATKGTHTVNITFNKEVLKNSPFEVNIIDPPPAPGEIPVSPSLSKKDIKIQEKERKKEEKEKAKREKEEKAATLKKEKKSKKFASKTSITKIPSLSRVGQPSSLVVEVSGQDQLEIHVTDSRKNEIGTEIVEIEPGVMQINFTPQQVGDHEIEVKYGGHPVTGSPFTCRAYDPTKIKVGNIPKGLLEKPVYFTVDASEAGVGNLEVAVNEGRVPSMAHALGQHRYDISFVPKENVDHTITVRFNNEPVPGSPFVCKLVTAAQASASGPGLERIPVDEVTEIQIHSDTGSPDTPAVRIRDPQSNDLPVNVTRSRNDETLHIATYTPKAVGNHQIDISVNGEPIAGSPFTAKAYDARQCKLSPCDRAVVGKPATFTIDAAKAGAGNMEIIVSVDNRNVPNFVQAEGQARFKVSFTPQDAKEHVISVRFNGISVPGSPMRCQVESASTFVPATSAAAPVLACELQKSSNERKEPTTALGRELKNAQVGQKKGFTVENPGGRAAECNVIITDPKGGPLPVRCYKQQDDSYWVEFTPEQTGNHTIEVTFGEMPIAGSPFRCEVVDPRRVTVKGLPDQLVLRHATAFKIDRRDAGIGELAVEVQDPSGVPLKIDSLKSPSGEQTVTFLPNKLGPHKVNVKLAGFQLPGYPQTLQAGEQEKPAVYGAAIDQSIKIGEPASLLFDPKKATGGLKINVTSPNGEKIRHNVMRRPNGTSEVVFYPEEVGTYRIGIDFNNKPVSESPFDVRVVDPSKVIVNDLDMDRDGSFLLRLGQSNAFDVDATAAGPGKLRTEVRDADGTLVVGDGPAVEDLGRGRYRVRFVPQRSGKYSIYLYWNELPVESAFPVRARSSAEDMPTTSRETREVHAAALQSAIPRDSRDRDVREMGSERQRDSAEIREARDTVGPLAHARDKSSSSSLNEDISRVMLRGDGLHRAALGQPNEFIIDGADLQKEGRITATLLGSKADIPVRVQQLNYNVFKATYTPLTPGTYELHVLWNGKHVKNSPFKVIADTSASPADLIGVDSSTLKIGIINEDIKTVIDTRRAGPVLGQLSAHCMGPNKPAYCELYDHRDGTYTLCIRPAEVGKHTLVIKYNDEHVRGSPFVVHVSLPPDPSKVRVYGPGIEHGILSLYKSNFVVETRGAGAGQLTVRVRGPKGAFNVEMQREKRNERTIHCKYEPKEPGDYQVEVKWHGEHVPGSPFLVIIVDTEQELQRFLRGEAPSPIPSTPFIPPGWVGPPPMLGPPPHMSGGPRPLPFGPAGAPPPGALTYGAPMPPRHKARHY